MGRKSIFDKIEDMKKEIEQLEIKAASKNGVKSSYPFEIGKAYFFRTITFHLTGKIVAIKANFLVLKEAAWIAYSGRFSQFINKGELGTSGEVEPVDVEVYLNLNSITDAFEWKNKLLRDQK